MWDLEVFHSRISLSPLIKHYRFLMNHTTCSMKSLHGVIDGKYVLMCRLGPHSSPHAPPALFLCIPVSFLTQDDQCCFKM